MFDSFSDIQLDIPHAHTLLEKFTDMCARDGIIPISFTMKVPSRYVYVQGFTNTNSNGSAYAYYYLTVDSVSSLQQWVGEVFLICRISFKRIDWAHFITRKYLFSMY